MAMKLSKRLLAIAAMVDPSSYLADIGSDHGFLPIHLVQEGKIQWAQAVENKMGPYLNLKHNVESAGLSTHISVTFSDGISSLNGGVDTLVLAGMGGQLTIDILSSHVENLDNIQTIILDPHKDLSKTRYALAKLGYHIVDEAMVHEDKIYYCIMKFRKGEPKRPYTVEELMFGPVIMKKRDETFRSYLLHQKAKLNKLLNGPISKESREKYLRQYRLVKAQLDRYPESE